jgi:hypothetical protein
MKTGFSILVATHDLQKLPAWLTLEKLRLIFDPCHPTQDSPKKLRQRDALQQQRRCTNGNRTTACASNVTRRNEINLSFFHGPRRT